MTAAAPARVPAGTPGGTGGRFATRECPRVYALLDALAPADDGPDERTNYTAVPAPKCPHGHYRRYALGFTDKGAPNCPPCHRP